MRSLYAIYRKEMGHYFVSPIAYVVVGIFLALSAFFLNYFIRAVLEESMQMQIQQMQMGTATHLDTTMEVLQAFFGMLPTLILFLTPILTMGVFAEERKRGTMELLMTSPVTEVQIVLGKFLASLSLFAIMLLGTVAYLAFVYLRSDPVAPWRMLIAGYAGVMLLAACLLALGSFISSLTENQLIAAVLTFAAFLVVWVIDLGTSAGGTLGTVLQYLSVTRPYEDFARGIVDTSGLIYYFSFIFFFVFLTVRSVDSMRWRRA
jgi:ABC-2 type transport system permease protein